MKAEVNLISLKYWLEIVIYAEEAMKNLRESTYEIMITADQKVELTSTAAAAEGRLLGLSKILGEQIDEVENKESRYELAQYVKNEEERLNAVFHSRD